MGTPEQDAARRALGLEPLPDEPVQGTPAPAPVAVAEPMSERDKARANLGLPPLDTQAQPAVSITAAWNSNHWYPPGRR